MSETNNTKQAAWVALGSLFSFGFGIVSSMILSRYFDKIEYGTYKQVLYVYNSLLAVFTLGLPKAYSYFLPRSPIEEVKSLIKKITNLFFILGGILSLFLFFFSGNIADFFKNPELNSALKIFSIVPFFMMPTMGLEGILAVYKKTRLIALYTFITRLTMLISVVLPTFFLKLTCNEALIGFVFSSFFSFSLALYLKYYPIKNEKKIPTKCTYSEIFKFTMPLFFATIWGILVSSIDQFFVSRYFGVEVFADFSNGATELPFIGMIVGACGTVLTPLFTKQIYVNADFKQLIYPVWNNALVKSVMLIYPIVIFCIYDADLIMEVMYGSLYESSGDFFRIKLFSYFVKVISFVSILLALGATRFYAKVYMYGFFILALAEYISIRLFNNPLVIMILSVAFIILSCLIFLKYIANAFHIDLFILFPISIIVRIILLSIITLFFVYTIKEYFYFSSNSFFQLSLDFIIFLSIYLPIALLCRLKYFDIIKVLIK